MLRDCSGKFALLDRFKRVRASVEADNHDIFVSFYVEFLPKRSSSMKTSYVRIEEGKFVQNEWVPGRVHNGDEGVYHIKIGNNPAALRIELYQYK